MAGMRALGRVYDVVSAPSGINLCLKDVSGIGFLAVNGTTTAAVLTVTAATKFTGGTTSNWTAANGFGLPAKVYTRTANTAAWVENAVSSGSGWSGNVLTIPLTTTGLISYVDFFVSQLADLYDYINVTVSGTGCTLPVAVLYDLDVQRTPANLRIPSA